MNNRQLLVTDYACYSCIFLTSFLWKPIVPTCNGEKFYVQGCANSRNNIT